MTEYTADHYQGLGLQKMRTEIDPLAEQHSEHHFSKLQTCIPVYINKEQTDAKRVRNSRYLQVIVCSYTLWRLKLTIQQHGSLCCSCLLQMFCITALYCSGLSSCGEWKVKKHVQFYQKLLKIPFSTKQSVFFSLADTAVSRTDNMDPLIMEVHLLLFQSR